MIKTPTSVLALVLSLVLTLAALPLEAAAKDKATTTPEKVGMSSEGLATLAEAFEQYVQDGELAGAVILVTRRGEPVFHQAFGERDLESDDAMEKGDIFRIASQTKALVSTAIMMLQEDGKLLIKHPVSRYLPAYEKTTVAVEVEGGGYGVVPAKRQITIRDLLTHTAGVGYGGGLAAEEWEQAGIQGWYFADRDKPVRHTIDQIAELPFEAHPGERYVYGYSTDILGAVVEAASGKTLDVFLEERLFRPLGMNDTHFYLPKDKIDRLATVYSATEDGLEKAPDPGHMVGQGHYVEGPRTSFSGGAGLLSTAHDYSRFLQMMLGEGELDGVRLLSPKTVQLMTANHVGDKFAWASGAGFGLGFRVLLDLGAFGEHGSVGDYGWGGAYHSVYWVDPAEELVVVYMTQLIPAGDVDDQQVLRSLVYSAITD